MWFIAIIVLCANGVMGLSTCKRTHFLTCGFPFSVIPETVEEIEELCPRAANYFECSEEFRTKCAKRPPVHEGEYENIRNLVEDICSNGTSIHTAVFENIKCIHDRFTNRSAECNAETEQVVNAFKNFRMATSGQKDDLVLRMKGVCVFTIYNLGCFITSASTKCGPTVKDAIVDATNRSYFLRYQCSVQDMNDLRDISNSLQISDAQKNILNESLRRFAWAA